MPRMLVTLIVGAVLALHLGAPPADAQEDETGGIAGSVFIESTNEGGGGTVWVQAFRAGDLSKARGTCVDGYRYRIGGLEPGVYKVRFGFGCGAERDQPPYEWAVQVAGAGCAAEVFVAAGLVTDGINADVNPETGPEYRCNATTNEDARGAVGVQRPADEPVEPTPVPTEEIRFTPGVIAAPDTAGTSAGAIVVLALIVLGVVAAIVVVLLRRGARAAGSS